MTAVGGFQAPGVVRRINQAPGPRDWVNKRLAGLDNVLDLVTFQSSVPLETPKQRTGRAGGLSGGRISDRDEDQPSPSPSSRPAAPPMGFKGGVAEAVEGAEMLDATPARAADEPASTPGTSRASVIHGLAGRDEAGGDEREPSAVSLSRTDAVDVPGEETGPGVKIDDTAEVVGDAFVRPTSTSDRDQPSSGQRADESAGASEHPWRQAPATVNDEQPPVALNNDADSWLAADVEGTVADQRPRPTSPQQPAAPSAPPPDPLPGSAAGYPPPDLRPGSAAGYPQTSRPPSTPPPAHSRPGSAAPTARRRGGDPPPADLPTTPTAKAPAPLRPSQPAAGPLSPPPAYLQPHGSTPDCLLPAPPVFAVLPVEAQELLLRSERARLAALPAGPSPEEQRNLHEAAEIFARAAGGDTYWAGAVSAGEAIPVVPWGSQPADPLRTPSGRRGDHQHPQQQQQQQQRPGSSQPFYSSQFLQQPPPPQSSPGPAGRSPRTFAYPELDPSRHPGKAKFASVYGNNALARFPPERRPAGDPAASLPQLQFELRPGTAAGATGASRAPPTPACAKRRAMSAGTRRDPRVQGRQKGLNSTFGSQQSDPFEAAPAQRAKDGRENLLLPFQAITTTAQFGGPTGSWAEAPPASFQLARLRDTMQRPHSAIPADRLDKIRKRSDQMRSTARSANAPDPWTLHPNTNTEPQKVFFTGSLSRGEMARRRAEEAANAAAAGKRSAEMGFPAQTRTPTNRHRLKSPGSPWAASLGPGASALGAAGSTGRGGRGGAQALAPPAGSPRERLAAWEAQQRAWAKHEELLVAEERRCVEEADYAGAGAVRAEIRKLRAAQLEEVEKAVRERYRQQQAALIAEMGRVTRDTNAHWDGRIADTHRYEEEKMAQFGSEFDGAMEQIQARVPHPESDELSEEAKNLQAEYLGARADAAERLAIAARLVAARRPPGPHDLNRLIELGAVLIQSDGSTRAHLPSIVLEAEAALAQKHLQEVEARFIEHQQAERYRTSDVVRRRTAREEELARHKYHVAVSSLQRKCGQDLTTYLRGKQTENERLQSTFARKMTSIRAAEQSELASLRLEKTKLEAALAPGTAGKEGNLRSRTAPAAGGLMLPQAPGTWGSTPQRPATAR